MQLYPEGEVNSGGYIPRRLCTMIHKDDGVMLYRIHGQADCYDNER